MKGFSKPISSPSRAEKFPPPLMRFLRSNAGSRSRGRSRSSPMFRMRSKRDAAPVIEPSSPKVTCFGQVHVKTSSKTTASRRPKNRCSAPRNLPCRWLKKTLFCHTYFSKFHVKSRPPLFCGGGLFFGYGLCKKVGVKEDSSRVCSNGGCQRNESHIIDRNYKNLEIQVRENKGDFLDSSPPKNALLLTRCRSAPYRSSSLVGQFWGSPLASTETGYDRKIEAKSKYEFQQLQKPGCDRPSCDNLMVNSGRHQKSENSVYNVQDPKENVGNTVHPLLLTRSKSEPARTGERFSPDINFWRQRRLGAINPVHNIIQ